jgi:RNA polymerase sigma factor (sigma-70 family)
MRKSSGVVYRASTARTSQAHAAEIGPLLAKLRSEEAQAGWEEFLLQYSPALYQTARTLARDEDDVADCFVHICEQLAKDRFGRLLRFKPDGAASFLTWLRVVARNLCHDWHRKKHGRARPFKILQNLPPLELETYRFRFERHLSQEETLQQLRGTWPSIEVNELIETERRIEERLNPAQRWILSVRNQALGTSMRANDEDELGMMEFADPAPSPESAVEDKEQRRALRKCVEALRAEDRLILRLRFDDELSLDEISQLAGLGDAQRVHRRLTSILEKLRSAVGKGSSGKARPVSVK